MVLCGPLWSFAVFVMVLCGPLWSFAVFVMVLCGPLRSFVVLCGPLRYLVRPVCACIARAKYRRSSDVSCFGHVCYASSIGSSSVNRLF